MLGSPDYLNLAKFGELAAAGSLSQRSSEQPYRGAIKLKWSRRDFNVSMSIILDQVMFLDGPMNRKDKRKGFKTNGSF